MRPKGLDNGPTNFFAAFVKTAGALAGGAAVGLGVLSRAAPLAGEMAKAARDGAVSNILTWGDPSSDPKAKPSEPTQTPQSRSGHAPK